MWSNTALPASPGKWLHHPPWGCPGPTFTFFRLITPYCSCSPLCCPPLQHRCLTFLVTSALGQALASVTKALVCPLCTSQAHRRGFNFLSTHVRLSPPLFPSFYSHLLSLLHPPPTLHTELVYTTPKTARTLSSPSLCLGPFRLEHFSTCPTMPPADLYRIPFIFQDSVPRPDSEALPPKAPTVPSILKGTSLAVFFSTIIPEAKATSRSSQCS